MRRVRTRLSYANVMATVAVFLALGGGAYAATQLKKNSVGTQQLKNSSVTGEKVKDGSLSGADINSSTLAQVPSASRAGSAETATQATNSGALQGHPASDFLGANAQAADSARLGGRTGSEFGAVLSAQTSQLAPVATAANGYGPASGIANFSKTAPAVTTLTPDLPLSASHFSAQLTSAPGGGNGVEVLLTVNGAAVGLACLIKDEQSSCVNGADAAPIEPGSQLAINILEVRGGAAEIPAESLLSGFQLTP
jgi:hypothetical protein